MPHTLGLASGFFKHPTADSWRAALAAGFTDAELGFPWTLPPDEMFADALRSYAILREAGVRVSSAHLPFGPLWEPSNPDPAAREDALRRFEGLLDWVGAQGIPLAVLHASFEPIPSAERPARLRTAADSVARLDAYARERGVALAIENLPRTCLGNTAAETLLLAGHAAGVCFDVNHLLTETHAEFLAAAGQRVITTHLSDYDLADERHWFPGTGAIDWPALPRALDAAGYTGRYIFELDEDGTPAMGQFTPARLAEALEKFWKTEGFFAAGATNRQNAISNAK
ncbi:MAG: sugar phosphate isomerase/epimerase [Oscillospiraceae bacterium]|nr:sugar phosphate isomerase/epimerase [Oscillospiraceae bacterium]